MTIMNARKRKIILHHQHWVGYHHCKPVNRRSNFGQYLRKEGQKFFAPNVESTSTKQKSVQDLESAFWAMYFCEIDIWVIGLTLWIDCMAWPYCSALFLPYGPNLCFDLMVQPYVWPYDLALWFTLCFNLIVWPHIWPYCFNL